ncbi:MAG: hypothetical protein IKI84_02185 [Clostridia bacterium]|nr:hypothetical protein [Clostridia bacterium]
MDQQALEQAADNRIGESHRLAGGIYKRCKLGAILPEEIRDKLYSDALQAIKDIFEPFGLSYKIDKANYDAFADEYDRYKRQGPFEGKGDKEWLRYDRYEDTVIKGAKTEADFQRTGAPCRAKAVFFKVLDEYRFPVEYFLPLPDEIPDPHAYCVHTYAHSFDYLIRFECADGGAFFDDPDPSGKEFRLTDRNGLKAGFFIDRVFLPGDKVPFRNGFVEKRPGCMAATGTVEGYTTEEKHEFEIEKEGNDTLRIHIRLSMEDVNLFLRFPLWKPYFNWERKKAGLLENSVFGHFKEEFFP